MSSGEDATPQQQALQTSSSGSDEGVQSPPAKHQARCHGCGGYPIRGVKYKSKVKWEFNMCEGCFDVLPTKREKLDDFVPIERPNDEASAGLPELPKPSKEEYIETSPISNKKESLEGLRNNPNATLAKLHFSDLWDEEGDQDDESVWDEFETLIATHKNIKRMAICNCCLGIGKPICNEGMIKVLRGVAANKNLQYFAMPMRKEARAMASDEVRLAFRQLLETNQNLTTLVIWQELNSEKPTGNTVDDSEDLLAKSIFEGLAVNTSLKILRFDSYAPLSSGARDFAIQAIQKNKDSSLLRLCASFEDGVQKGNENNRLDLVLRCKHEKWVERVSNANASYAERGVVLDEILERYHQNPHMAVHYLTHSCPYLLQKTAEEEPRSNAKK